MNELASSKVPGKQQSPSIRARVLSQVPGRVRLRLEPACRHPRHLDPIHGALKERLEIYRVRVNPDRGSLTIFHARELSSFEDIRTILQDLGVVLMDMAGGEEFLLGKGESKAATSVAEAAAKLNRRLKRATDGTVDLTFLFPLSLGILALRQLAVKGWQFDLIPWYVLAWYAFDSFLKLRER